MDYPLIRGNRFDYSSIEANINGAVFVGISEIDYSHKLDPGMMRGTSALPNGRTRGQYEAKGSITLYKSEAAELIAALGDGYLERSFDIVVHYAEAGSPMVTDTLIGCRIVDDGNSHKEGNDALTQKLELSIMRVDMNGVKPVRGAR